MSFDPSDLTVKKAIEKMHGLSDEELDALYDAELEGKGRKSLLDAITEVRADIREAAPVEEVVEEEVVEAAPKVEESPEEIDAAAFLNLSQQDRTCWKCVDVDRFVKVG